MNKRSIPPGIETRCFLLGSNLLHDVPSVLKQCFPNRRPWLIADENTWAAAGAKVQQTCLDAGLMPHEPYCFPAHPQLHADETLVAPLRGRMPQDAVPVAVGGGTINDIVKRVAETGGTRYLCVPTAPSVDGYTASGAAMLADGLKQTLPCAAPLAIVVDTVVLQNAPREMAAAGYADLYAKISAGWEWQIVDLLGIEPIRQDVWALVQDPLRKWLTDPQDLEAVFDGLAATGYAMQLYRDSRPASGAEHLASHVWEMESVTASHGFKVGIGTLAATALAEEFCALTLPDLQRLAVPAATAAERETEVDRLLIRNVYGNAKAVAMKKFRTGEELLTFRRQVYDHWEELQKRVLRQLIPFTEVKAQLQAAGCPVHPRQIAVDEKQFYDGLRRAQLIRKRYTLVDLLYELGVFDEMLRRISRYFQ